MMKSGRLTCEEEKDWRLTEGKWNSDNYLCGDTAIGRSHVLFSQWTGMDIKVPREMYSWCSCGEGKKTGLTRPSTE